MTEPRCICTRVCDCQNPEPPDEENGVALCSNECPVHNLYQQPHPECRAITHWFQEVLT